MRSILASSAIAVVFTSAAAADTVEMRRLDDGLGRNITLFGSQVGGSFSFNIGQYQYEFRNGTGIGTQLTGVHTTFCIDLSADSGPEWQLFNLVPLSQAPDPGPAMGAVKAQAIADVFDGANNREFTDADWAAAFQMILWEIIYDYNGTTITSINTTTGSVRFSSGGDYFPDVLTHFTELRSFVGTRGAPVDVLRGATNPDFQDQLVAVPSPGSIALGLAGIGVLAIGRRRR